MEYYDYLYGAVLHALLHNGKNVSIARDLSHPGLYHVGNASILIRFVINPAVENAADNWECHFEFDEQDVDFINVYSQSKHLYLALAYTPLERTDVDPACALISFKELGQLVEQQLQPFTLQMVGEGQLPLRVVGGSPYPLTVPRNRITQASVEFAKLQNFLTVPAATPGEEDEEGGEFGRIIVVDAEVKRGRIQGPSLRNGSTGFITSFNDHKGYFFHKKGLLNRHYDQLQGGEDVTFIIGRRPGNDRVFATQINILPPENEEIARLQQQNYLAMMENTKLKALLNQMGINYEAQLMIPQGAVANAAGAASVASDELQKLRIDLKTERMKFEMLDAQFRQFIAGQESQTAKDLEAQIKTHKKAADEAIMKLAQANLQIKNFQEAAAAVREAVGKFPA